MIARWLLLFICSTFGVAKADFLVGLYAYENGDYTKAHYEFSELLPLGNAQAAYNLAAMALNGNGMKADAVKALAYMQFAAHQGHKDAAHLISRFRQNLSHEQLQQSQVIFQRLTNAVVISKQRTEPDVSTYRALVKITEPMYPLKASNNRQFGYVSLRVLVNEAGNVEVVDTIDSFPEGVFEKSAITAVQQWRYEPKTHKTIQKIQLRFTAGRIEHHAVRKILSRSKLWELAGADSAKHQEIMGSLLYMLQFNSPIELHANEELPLVIGKLPNELFSYSELDDIKIDDFDGWAKVEVNNKGRVTKILDRSNEQSTKGLQLGYHLNIGKIAPGLYRLSKSWRDKISVQRILEVSPSHDPEFWWSLAAKNGNRRAQQILATKDPQWENYLIQQQDPAVQAWLGTKLLISTEASARARGKALLDAAVAQNSVVARQIKQIL
jgi:TonB family protein